MSARPYLVYGLRDPGTGAVRYVGVTRDLRNRLAHYRSHSKRSALPVNRWWRKVSGEGREPVPVILEAGIGDRDGSERKWIAFFRLASSGGLLNLADGGVFDVPPEARKRAGEKLRTRYFSPEHRARISAAKRGQPRSDADAVRARLKAVSAANKGRKLNLSTAERERRREQFGSIRTLRWARL